MNIEGTVSAVTDAIRAADRRSAMTLMQRWASEHGYDRLASDILVPVLGCVCEEDAAEDETPISRGYIAAKVAEGTMDMIAARTGSDKAALETKGPVVIGNIEDDFHALGRRILGSFLKADGWQVHDMGNDVLAGEFVDRAVEIGASVIGISAMMYTTAENIRGVREELDRRYLSGTVKLAVGGAIFILRPELAQQVGGDGTARTAVEAPALFAKLHDEARQCHR